MMDIFVSPKGHMLQNWENALPEAVVTTSLNTVTLREPAVFWVHANANDQEWLDQTMAELAQKFKGAKVVVLANTPNQSDAQAVMASGVSGYCHAYSPASMLKELKTVVEHGGLWLGQDLLKTLISATKKVVHNSSINVAYALNLLTTREKEVALDVSEGLSNKEIARLLDITERTVKAHVSAVLEKLAIKDRMQLALVLNEKVSESQQQHFGPRVASQVTSLSTKSEMASL